MSVPIEAYHFSYDGSKAFEEICKVLEEMHEEYLESLKEEEDENEI